MTTHKKEKNSLNSALSGALTSSLRNSLGGDIILPIINSLAFYVTTLHSKKSKEQLVTVDGSEAVSVWIDLSGNNNDISQASASLKPVYTESAINGLPALRLDGAGDFLEGNLIVTGDKITAFMVAKRSVLVNQTTALNTYNSGVSGDIGLNSFIMAWEGAAGTGLNTFRNGTKSSHTHPGNNIPYIFTTRFDGTNNIAFLNGTAAAAVASAGNFNINTLLVGARRTVNVPNIFYNGNIGEIIVYDRALSTSEKETIESYLSAKWGIALV